MKTVITALMTLGLATGWWEPLFRPSNPRQLTEEGIEAWTKGDATAARKSFAAAAASDDDPIHLFNTGTAALGEGAVDEGARLMGAALKMDPSLAADGSFNEGTALLRDQRLDEAVDRLQESLRRDPSRQDAKRNLELALMRREQQNAGAGGEQSQPSDGEDGQQEQDPQEGEPDEGDASEDGREGDQQQPGELDAEAVLRAVAQQEAEELKRMRDARIEAGRRGTGW